MGRKQDWTCALGLAGAWTLAASCWATTVTEFDLTQLSDLAAQVVIATVSEVRSDWAVAPAAIESTVKLSALTYWKGAPATADAVLELAVPGGSVGSIRMQVAGAPEFQPGERWILFLLPQYRTHPVVGIWEGAFRIQDDGQGVERVLTASGRPVVSADLMVRARFRATSEPQASAQVDVPSAERLQIPHGYEEKKLPSGADELSCGNPESRFSCSGPTRKHLDLPKGIAVHAANTETSSALTLHQFEALLEPILSRSRVWPIVPSDQRKIPTQFQSVPLLSATAPDPRPDAEQPKPVRGPVHDP